MGEVPSTGFPPVWGQPPRASSFCALFLLKANWHLSDRETVMFRPTPNFPLKRRWANGLLSQNENFFQQPATCFPSPFFEISLNSPGQVPLLPNLAMEPPQRTNVGRSAFFITLHCKTVEVYELFWLFQCTNATSKLKIRYLFRHEKSFQVKSLD